MTARVVRDWRGVKYRMNECSSADLAALKSNAQHADELIRRFLRQIDEEIRARAVEGSNPGRAA